MDFRKALAKALGICGERAVDPTLLYYALCDAIGNNLQLKPQAEAFHHFNQTCQIVETMAKDPDPRMILTLLEKCKKQPDAPEKLCLKWIHTVFEIYYCAKHRKEEQTEQVLKSIEQDFFEPEQEGLVLPKPKKARKKTPQKAPGAVKAVAPAPIIATPTIAKSVPIAAHPSLKIVQAPIPYIPDKAWVYVAEGSPIVHVSADCPHIRPALNLTMYRATYERAKYKDFVRINNLKKNTSTYYYLSRNHCPPICPKCGEFTPILSYRNPKREYKQL